MKVGIYIDGLGQSIAKESLVSYTTRLKNECDFHKTGVTFELKVEKIKYGNNRESNVASIIEHNNTTVSILYKMYEFRYGDIMTDGFKERSLLIKNIFLFGLVIKKLPLLIKRIFIKKTYSRPFQTFYIFSLFFVIAFAILFTVPATITVISNFFLEKSITNFVHAYPWILTTSHFLHINSYSVKQFAQFFVSIISIILLLAPSANIVITSLATEFVCAHQYLQFGQQKQDILGNLDQLFEYIIENEADPKIHIHAYSYGTLVAIDYLFPYGSTPSGNLTERTEALITIGTPFDFINSYYSNYYSGRSAVMENKIRWINIYSIADALASNFRSDELAGEAEYGITVNGIKPVNVNYEVVVINQYNLGNFISLASLKVHGMYWGSDINGASCLHPIYQKMILEKLI